MDVLATLNDAGAVYLEKHFVYKSGKHGSGYINMDPIFPSVALITGICRGLAYPFNDVGVQTVGAPATGGIVLAYQTAETLSGYQGKWVDYVWADKVGDDFAFERAGFASRLKGKQLLIVEDLLTTGGSVIKTRQAAEAAGAKVIGVSAICNRGGVTAEQLGVPRLESLAAVDFAAIDAVDCPLCASEVPIVDDIGHGPEYKLAHPDYTGGYVSLLVV